MTTAASFLSVTDPSGDLGYVTHALELASRKDVGAQAVFFFGSIAGSILTPDERAEYQGARPILLKELGDRTDYYEGLGVHDITQLGYFMTQNAANYRRQGENNAVRTVRSLLGLRDSSGKWVESGRALLRARRVYADLERLFKKSPVPVYVTADTGLAEELIDASRWLHFAWFSLGGVAIRALCVTSGDVPDLPAEAAPGIRRGGRPVSLAEYPLASGDVVFAVQINPILHEMLSSSTGKLAILRGDGGVDRTYQDVLVATQKAQTAYLYRIDGRRVTRRAYPYAGSFGEPLKDDIQEALTAPTLDGTLARRRELEDQAKLAGLGRDLIHFVDLMRSQNPELAKEIERSTDRVEVVLRYVRTLEEQGSRMADLLSTQRAGMERLAKAIEPFLSREASARVFEALNVPPDRQHDVATWDEVNQRVASIIVQALQSRPTGAYPAVEKE